jgi:hypothetical protein
MLELPQQSVDRPIELDRDRPYHGGASQWHVQAPEIACRQEKSGSFVMRFL